MLEEAQLSDYAKRLADPISATDPCGENPKNSNEYELAKGEVAKNSGRDYLVLKTACEKVLCEQSKDLTAFGYMILALSQTDGAGAVCDTLAAMCYVSRTQWETIHPQRPVGRANAIKWLNEEKLVGTLEKLSATAPDQASVESALLGLEDLKELTFKHFADSPPSLKGLQQIVKKWSQDLKASAAPAPAPTAPKAESAQPASVATQSTSESSPTASAQSGGAESKSDTQKLLQKVAFFYLQSEPQSVMGYKLLRTLRWQELTAEPKAEAGKTLLAPPNPARAKFFEGLVQTSNWDGILEKSEIAFTEPGLHFWFDLQYALCKALRGKAGAYTACAEAVEYELVKLLLRVPTLASLQYKDGTPFASPITQEWFEEIKAAQGSGGNATKAVSKAVSSVSLQEDLEKATQLAATQKLDEAVSLLQSGIEFGSLRERSERKMAIARLCSLHKQPLVAEHLFEDLCSLAEAKSLDQWVPDFVSELLDLRIKNLSVLMRNSEFGDKAHFQHSHEKTLAWLARISPAHAVRIK